MIYLLPCRVCNLSNGCAEKKAVLEQIRGAGLTSAKFRCQTFERQFHIGQVVEVMIHGWMRGVVVGYLSRRHKWAVILDDGWREAGGKLRSDRGVVAIPSDRIFALDEPDNMARVAEADPNPEDFGDW